MSFIEEEMKVMLSGLAGRLVSTLSAKYGFDGKEAMLLLEGQEKGLEQHVPDTDKDKERRLLPEVPLPFCRVLNKDWCRGLRLNHGLHTQCTQLSNDLCKTCLGQGVKNGTGRPTYGRIEDRMDVSGDLNNWRDPSGKLVTPYTKVMAQMNITRQQAEREAEKLGWTIPEEHFITMKRSAGRPKKSIATSDTESESGEPKKRGRPRKHKIVETMNPGDDLIAQILLDARPQSHQENYQERDQESHQETYQESHQETYQKSQQTTHKEKSDQESQQPTHEEDHDGKSDQESHQESDQESDQESRQESHQPQVIQPRKRKSKMRLALSQPYKAPVSIEPQHPYEAPVSIEPQHTYEPISATNIHQAFEWEGKTYLRTQDNVLYDRDTQEEIGVWNKSEERIVELPTSDFD